MNEVKLDISNVLNQAWELAKKHGLILALFFFVIHSIYNAISYSGYPWQLLMTNPDALNNPNNPFLYLSLMSTYYVTSMFGGIVLILLYAGILNLILQLTTGKLSEVKISAFAMPISRYLGFLVVALIVYIVTCIGVLFCILPGIYLGTRLYLAPIHYLAHPEDGISGAIQRSWDISKDNFWNLFLIQLLIMVFTFLGLMACCVGVFFAYALSYFMVTVAYVTLTKKGEEPDEPVNEEPAAEEPTVNPADNYQSKESQEKNEGDYNKSY